MPEPLRFEEFDLDVERYELRRSGRTVKLERIPMELLILLLQSDGKLVRREEINRRLWGENALQDTEHSVNTAVNKLRFILRDDPREPRFIQTVVGQGYRFIAKVAVDPEPVVPAAVVREREEDRPSAAGHNGSGPGPERKVAEASILPVLPSEPLPPALPIQNPVHEKQPGPAPVPRRRRLALLAGLVLVAGLLTAAAVWLHD